MTSQHADPDTHIVALPVQNLLCANYGILQEKEAREAM
jgi:hypothetical protein